MTVIPTSSCSSRISACSGVSSDSIFPPGNSSLFAIWASAARWVIKISPCGLRIIPTAICSFSLNALHKKAQNSAPLFVLSDLSSDGRGTVCTFCRSRTGTDRYGPLYVRRFAPPDPGCGFIIALMAELLHLRRARPLHDAAVPSPRLLPASARTLLRVLITSYFSDSSIAANIENDSRLYSCFGSFCA